MDLNGKLLLQYIEENLGVDASEIDEDTPLFSSGLIDSGGMADLIVYVETEGRLSFKPEDITLDHLDTIGRILSFVAARHGA